jgi:hypothetical protein
MMAFSKEDIVIMTKQVKSYCVCGYTPNVGDKVVVIKRRNKRLKTYVVRMYGGHYCHIVKLTRGNSEIYVGEEIFQGKT